MYEESDAVPFSMTNEENFDDGFDSDDGDLYEVMTVGDDAKKGGGGGTDAIFRNSRNLVRV